MAVKSRITRFPCFWSLQLYFRRWVAMNISRFFKRTIPIKSWRDICAKINGRLRSREEKWLTCNEKKEISLWKDQSLVNLRTHRKILSNPRLLALNRITARSQNSPACYVHKLTFETEAEYKMWHVCCVHSHVRLSNVHSSANPWRKMKIQLDKRNIYPSAKSSYYSMMLSWWTFAFPSRI